MGHPTGGEFMSHRDSGNASLSVLLFATAMAMLTLTLVAVDTSVTKIVQARSETAQVYWLSRGEAVSALVALQHGQSVRSTSISCAIGYIIQDVTTDGPVVTVTSTAQTAVATHATRFEFNTVKKQLVDWQDAIQGSAVDSAGE
jgi:hypothetical protein